MCLNIEEFFFKMCQVFNRKVFYASFEDLTLTYLKKLKTASGARSPMWVDNSCTFLLVQFYHNVHFYSFSYSLFTGESQHNCLKNCKVNTEVKTKIISYSSNPWLIEHPAYLNLNQSTMSSPALFHNGVTAPQTNNAPTLLIGNVHSLGPLAALIVSLVCMNGN